MPLRVYIDTSILGLVFDRPVPQGVAEAIGELCDFQGVDFVTSSKTLQELLNHEDVQKRNLLKLIYRFMAKLPEAHLVRFVPSLFGAVLFGEATFGGEAERADPLFPALNTIFDRDDAEHILPALKGNCGFFLTLDSKTILSRARRYADRLQTVCAELSFVSPKELVTILRDRGHDAKRRDQQGCNQP